ncbi:hypothetical protein ACJMK2_029280 [Sinanodonta woodiana]|uniref:DZIP3-like HEPN domain-containing protein n=1 Tax=Sinanodonta woodiana TaxID=1069815 RepID=A0ABD3X9P2_SINWO
MASSCIEPYASCLETTHFARICRIVVDVFRDILWQVLTKEVTPADLPIQVQNYQNKLKCLDGKIKTWLVGISHSSSEIPSAEKFDVSSLYTLIRNLCITIPTPTTQWGYPPPAGGITLGDDIERVREFRNNLYGHATQAKIDAAYFNNICSDIIDVVSRFDVYFKAYCKSMKCDFKSDIQTILTCSMDKTLEDKYIEKLKKIDVLVDDVEEQVDNAGNAVRSVLDKFNELTQQVTKASQNSRDAKQDVDIALQEINKVNRDVGSVKVVVDEVYQKAGDAKRNVENMQQDLINFNQDVSKTNQEVVNVNQKIGSISQKVCEVMDNVSDVRKEVGYVRQEVGSIKQEVTNVKQDVTNVTHTCLDVKQDVVYVKQEVGIIKQEVGSAHQEVGNVKQQVGNLYRKAVDVKQNVGNVNQQVGDVKDAIGNVAKHVGDVKQHLQFLPNDAGVKQQICDINTNLEILHNKVDVLKKGKMFDKLSVYCPHRVTLTFCRV